jgi:hypothetical protein
MSWSKNWLQDRISQLISGIPYEWYQGVGYQFTDYRIQDVGPADVKSELYFDLAGI